MHSYCWRKRSNSHMPIPRDLKDWVKVWQIAQADKADRDAEDVRNTLTLDSSSSSNSSSNVEVPAKRLRKSTVPFASDAVHAKLYKHTGHSIDETDSAQPLDSYWRTACRLTPIGERTKAEADRHETERLENERVQAQQEADRRETERLENERVQRD